MAERVEPKPTTEEQTAAWVDEQLMLRDGDQDKKLLGRDQAPWEFYCHFGQYVLFQDEHLLVINKPAGVAAHFGIDTLVGVREITTHVLGQYTMLPHRLDKDTTGVMLVAKTALAHIALNEQFSSKSDSGLKKTYIAVLDGAFYPQEDVVASVRLTERPDRNMRVIKPEESTDRNIGRNSITIFRPIAVLRNRFGYRTLTEVELVTGLTHQIRVVAAEYLGHPVAGDHVYNPSPPTTKRQLLHALELQFFHPIRGERIIGHAPVATDIIDLVSSMQWEF